ncbi:uncharacterized protein [Antedon mediterranea]|uniref:uncharacterized protein n=1 Tax=Antedon mediterranea TaxID=105859 RepID=UPI003AF52BCD
MAAQQDMEENGGIRDELSESSQTNGTKKKHIQIQFMENNNSEDWHGTRMSLLSEIHVGYRNIERTLNERPSYTIPFQARSDYPFDFENEQHIARNHVGPECVDHLNGDMSNNESHHNRHLNGFFLTDINSRDGLMPQMTNGTSADHVTSADVTSNNDVQTKSEHINHIGTSDSNLSNCTSLPDTLPYEIDENQFDTQSTPHERRDTFRLQSNVLPERDTNTSEHLNEDFREEFVQNGHHSVAEDAVVNQDYLNEYRTSEVFQNNLDPCDAVSEENRRCCADATESVLNVISGEVEDFDERQSHKNSETDLEVELNNLLLENFSEQQENNVCEDKGDDVDSDLDAGSQDNSSSSSSSSSDIVDDMVMNVEMGNHLLTSSGATPTCVPGANSSDDSDEGLEADVCDDVSEREDESNNDEVKNLPMDDGDDDGCLDIWDMPQTIAPEFDEDEQERLIDNNSMSFLDYLPENYTLINNDNLCRNGNNDGAFNELLRHHSDFQHSTNFVGDFSECSEHLDTHRPCRQSLATGHNCNKLDEQSISLEATHASFGRVSMNSFQAVPHQPSFRQSISEGEHVKPNSFNRIDDENILEDMSNVSSTEYGFNHHLESMHREYKDSKNKGINEMFSTSVSHNQSSPFLNTEDHPNVSSTCNSASSFLSEGVRNCHLSEDGMMSIKNDNISINQRQYFGMATGGIRDQSNDQEDEKHSKERLLLQEVKDQMALQLRRLDERRQEELRFEEVLQAEFGEEEQDDLELDYEEDELPLRPSNFVVGDLIQEDSIASEEELSDVIESNPSFAVDDLAFAGIEGACWCFQEEQLANEASSCNKSEQQPCIKSNCSTWHSLQNEDVGEETMDEEQQREHDQPFIVWRRSLLKGEHEPNDDQISDLEGYVNDRNNEFVVRRKRQTNQPGNTDRDCMLDSEDFNHNQNDEEIESPESVVELEENVLRDRLLALKKDDADAPLWDGLHPRNVLGTSNELTDIHQSDTASAHVANRTSFVQHNEFKSELPEDCINICNNTKCVGKDDNTSTHNIVRVKKQRPKPVEKLPKNSAFIWTPWNAERIQKCHKGPLPYLPNAVRNALVALGYNPNIKEEQNLTQYIKENCSTVPKFLISSRKHFGLPEDIIASLSKHSNNEMFSRFFPFFPRRSVNLYKWLKEWISLGVVPIASFNPQVGIDSNCPIPNEWHHQMIYGLDEHQVYLCTPNITLSYNKIETQLSSDSVLLVAREEVVNRWDRRSRLGDLKQPPDNDSRWIQMNVLGQVVNVMREQSAPKPHEDYSRRYYYKPLKQRRTTHVQIPACYKGGITLCVKKEDKKAYEAVKNAPELPLR